MKPAPALRRSESKCEAVA